MEFQSYAMDGRTADLLTSIRHKMEDQESVFQDPNAPTTPTQESASDAAIPGVSDGSVAAGEAGTGSADNVNPALDQLDAYLTGIVEPLMQNYDFTAEEAFDAVYDCIDEISKDTGQIGPVPEDGAAPFEIGTWLGVAKTMGIDMMVLDDIRNGMMGSEGA